MLQLLHSQVYDNHTQEQTDIIIMHSKEKVLRMLKEVGLGEQTETGKRREWVSDAGRLGGCSRGMGLRQKNGGGRWWRVWSVWIVESGGHEERVAVVNAEYYKS